MMNEVLKKWSSNPMLKPRIAKVTVNIGVGESGERLQKAAKVLKDLTGQEPSIRYARRTIKEFGIRKGEPIAVVVTLRGERARSFLEKALEAIGRRIKASSFDDYGNVSFGIREHIMLPGVKYDPNIGVFGMDVAVTLERPGFRVMRRRRRKSRIPRRHRVSKLEAITYFIKELNVRVV
ncbi:MAG: 50S ribosomal protein L5 [Thermoprotei archaeon]|nr:MAG: 50S ribosomal protein L5 [Thermoprotei archaeon]